MAKFSLAFLVIALATLQVVFAETYYCNRPKCPSYGGCNPYKSKYPVGSTVYFFCKDGYSADGSSYARCLYSKTYKRPYWSHRPPVCRRSRQCPKLTLNYGVVKHSGFKPGSKAFHFCNKCFKLVGNDVRVCQKNGYWSGRPPVCKIIDCGKPPRPDYGKVWFRSTKCGSKASHSCNRGYVLVGNKIRKCQPNGYWSGKTPKCVPRKKY